MTAHPEQQLANLSPEQRRLLLLRLAQRKQSANGGTGVRPRTDEETAIPLSHAQERLWFLDQMESGNPAYNIAFALRVTGRLDIDALERAVNAVIERHEVLRTVFAESGGRAWQVVLDELRLPLPMTDLSELSVDARDTQVAQLAMEHAGQSFDLTAGPLLSVRLLALGEDHLLLVAVHHIVFDGWSTNVFVEELGAAYGAFVTDAPARLRSLPVQFADCAMWEREQLTGPVMSRRLEHWKHNLASAPPMSTLPPDRPRPAVQTHRGARTTFSLPASLSSGLTELARREGVTLNAVVLAGFAVVLHQATAASEVLLGTPVAGRTRVEMEPLIGCFANTLVLRIDLSGEPALSEMVHRAHRTISTAYAHQDAPYAQVVEAVAPPRDPSRNPLFQIMISLADIPETGYSAAGVTFTLEDLDSGGTDFDLFVTMSRGDSGIHGTIAYNADLFLAGTVRDSAERLQAVLAEMVAQPDRALSMATVPDRGHVSVAATFTADPIRNPFEFWLRFLRLPVTLDIAPYGQVVQHLLAGGRPGAACVVLLRWEDWLRHQETITVTAATPLLEQVLRDLGGAARVFRERSDTPLLIGVCPPSGGFQRQPWTGLFAQLEDQLTRMCAGLPDVRVISAVAWRDHYPVTHADDPRSDQLGHVPYTPEYFAMLATLVVRRLTPWWTCPVRTLLLDPARMLGTRDSTGPDSAALRQVLEEQIRYGRQVVQCAGADAAATLAALVAEGAADPATSLVLDPAPSVRDQIAQQFPDAVAVPSLRGTASLAHLWVLDPPWEAAAAGLGRLDSERLGYICAHLADATTIAERSRPVGHLVTDMQAPVVAPCTETEKRIAALWREVLGHDGVGVTTSFFAAGGHSLLAIRLLSRVQAEFGHQVSLYEFFTHPTIEQLAAVLDNGAPVVAEQIAAVPRDADLLPSSAQQRLWALAKIGDRPARHNITFAAAVDGPLDEEALRRAVKEITQRHEVLRTTFSSCGGKPALAVHEDANCWLPTVDLTGLPADERKRAVREQIQGHAAQVYDLAGGPLLRVQLLRASPVEHYLLLGMHHIVSDDWSWRIFMDELSALYTAQTTGEAASLPALPIQFADYAAWQRRWLDSAAAEPHSAYWRDQLAGAPPFLALPTDHPRPAARSDRAARATRLLPTGAVSPLRTLSGAAGVTLFSTLLAAFAVLLQRYSDQDDIVVGSPVAGRGRPELQPLIGYFADILPFRLDLTGQPGFRELVQRVHRSVLQAHQHAELPLASIVDAVRPPRDPAHHPLFQCMFSFIDLPEHTPALGELRMRPLDVPSTGIDFDLFLTLSWTGEELLAALEYSAEVFSQSTAEALLATFESLLTETAVQPDAAVSTLDMGPSFVVPPHRAPPGLTGGGYPDPVAASRLCVAATFTAEPVRAAVEFWLRELGVPGAVRFAPYAQVFQQLLDPAGVLGSVQDGADIVLLRWEDWLRYHDLDIRGAFPAAVMLLERHLHDLCDTVRAFRRRSDAALVIGICPASPRFHKRPWITLLDGLTEKLRRAARCIPATTVVSLERLAGQASAGEVYDEPADELGHMPYTQMFYSVLGTELVRLTCRLRGRRVRSLLLDPSRSLWQHGSCGDRSVADWQQELLRFLRPRMDHDRQLVLLCGADAEATLAGDWVVPLGPEDVTVHGGAGELVEQVSELVRQGLIDLAECVLLDPDPNVCHRVSARFPDLVVLPLPPDTERLRRYLDSTWVLDAPFPGGRPSLEFPPLSAVDRRCTELGNAERIHGAVALISRRGTSEPFVAPGSERERTLAGIWSEVLRVGEVGVHDNFFELGGDSMLAITVVSRAAQAGLAIKPRLLVEHPTVAQLAAVSVEGTSSHAEQGPVTGGMPLTPAQRWFFTTLAPRLRNAAHFNHPYYLTLREPVSPACLETALTLLAEHHDALRLRFREGRQFHASPGEPVPFDSYDLSELAAGKREGRMEAIAGRLQASLDVADGPLVRAVHFGLGPDAQDRLLIINHHLVVDAISRGILLEDLQTLCADTPAGPIPVLPAKTTSYQHWARCLHDYAQSARLRSELDFWAAQSLPEHALLPVDFAGGETTYGTARTLRTTFTEQETRAVWQAARDLGVNISALLVSVVAEVLAEWTGGEECAIALAGHGRENLFEDVDLTRTVGWCQVYYPLRIHVPRTSSGFGAGTVAAVKQQLDLVPHNGIGYGLLRFSCEDTDVRERLAAIAQPQVSFNYMGDFGFEDTPRRAELFGVSAGSFGPAQDETGIWPYLLDVVPSIVRRQLRIELNYGADVYHPATADGVRNRIRERVDQVVRLTTSTSRP